VGFVATLQSLTAALVDHVLLAKTVHPGNELFGTETLLLQLVVLAWVKLGIGILAILGVTIDP
jgi:hypothetical protein